MPDEIAYFAHISDTHIGPIGDFSRHGHYPLPCAERLVAILNGLPQRPDFVIHTGDVVADPDPLSYRLAARVFSQLNVPVYYVVGNHDRARDIHHFLPMGPKTDVGDSPNFLSYTFDVRGNRFLVVDARGPDEIDPHGIFAPAQLAVVEAEVSADGPPLTIFAHFPVLPMNSMWMDANMLVLNGMEFHNLLRQAKRQVRAVFHGHVHQPMQMWRDGVLYVSVASAFSQFGAWPGDLDVSLDPDHDPGYSFVHLVGDQTIVHHHTFPRPKQ